jgi:hypothetical protein
VKSEMDKKWSILFCDPYYLPVDQMSLGPKVSMTERFLNIMPWFCYIYNKKGDSREVQLHPVWDGGIHRDAGFLLMMSSGSSIGLL